MADNAGHRHVAVALKPAPTVNPLARILRSLLLACALGAGGAALAQVSTAVPEGAQVEGFLEVRHDRPFVSDLTLRIPLPPGRWTLRLKQERISTGVRATGLEVYLDQAENQRITSLVSLGVYPNLSVSWSAGFRCNGNLLRKDRGTSVDGYCYSLRSSTFMTLAADAAQTKVRERWQAAGLGKADVSLAFGGAFEKRGAFTVFVDPHVTPDAVSAWRTMFQGRQPREAFAAAWQRGATSGQLEPVTRWYEGFAATLARATGTADPAVAVPASLAEPVALLQAA